MTKRKKTRFDTIVDMMYRLRKSRLTPCQKVINLRLIGEHAAWELWQLAKQDATARQEVLDQMPQMTNTVLNMERCIQKDCHGKEN